MTKLFFILGLFPALASAAPNAVNLHLEYSYGERTSCRTDLTVEANEEYLGCDLKIDGKQAFLYLKMDPQPKRQYLYAMRVETVEADGRVKLISSPTIMALEGEPAKMSEESKEHPESNQTFSVLITRN